MKTLTFITPYSDEALKWDATAGRYELTCEWVKANLGNPFKDDATLCRRIKKNSRKIYNYIFFRSFSGNAKAVKDVITYTKEAREWLFEVLTTEMEADCDSGYNDISQAPAINTANGQSIDRNLLWLNTISVDTEQAILSCTKYLGINIMSQAPLPRLIRG